MMGKKQPFRTGTEAALRVLQAQNALNDQRKRTFFRKLAQFFCFQGIHLEAGNDIR